MDSGKSVKEILLIERERIKLEQQSKLRYTRSDGEKVSSSKLIMKNEMI